MPDERRLMSAACGGSILNRQPSEVFKLIGDMAKETRDAPPALDKESPAMPAPSSGKSEIGVLCSLFKQVVEIVNQTFKRGVNACQSSYGAARPKGKYHSLTEVDEGDTCGPSNRRGQGRQATRHNTPWVNDENPRDNRDYYQTSPDNQLPRARGPSLAERVHELALEQHRMMEDLTRLKAETKGALLNIATQLSQLALVIDGEVGEWIEPPFSNWIANEEENNFMQYMIKKFKKVDVNTPLIKKLKFMPRCARVLMDLFTKTVRYPDNLISPMGENVSAVLKREIPMKCKDPGIFSIPCAIRSTKIE